MNVGIHGVGTYLPETVRKNDWWPESVVETWRQRAAASLVRGNLDEENITPGMRASLVAMQRMGNDPFKGSLERRVMPEGMLTSDMETAAANKALATAKVDRAEVGLLMVNSQLPDYLSVPSAPEVHRKLGLSKRCMTVSVDAACNSFLAQLQLAEQMIRGGAVKYALLVQSSGFHHLAQKEEQHSVWFGDGATAVVVGPVADGLGILASSTRTDGGYFEGLVTGCPGARWYSKNERPVLYVPDRKLARKMLLAIADMGKEVLDEALQTAGVKKEDVSFYASHQSTVWFREVTQEHAGLGHAKHVDTFPWTGSLGPSNIPIMLDLGAQEGLLKRGDVFTMYTGGSGVTWTGFVVRWGVN